MAGVEGGVGRVRGVERGVEGGVVGGVVVVEGVVKGDDLFFLFSSFEF